MATLLSHLLNGISLGSVYAIIALGYTMVYGIAKMLNFAHGDVIMIGAYITFSATQAWHMPPAAGVLLSVAVCTVLGVLIEGLAYKPLRQATSLAVLITAIGMSYLLQNVALLVWGANLKSFPSVVSVPSLSLLEGRLIISGETIVTVLASVVIMAALTLFTGKTKMGKSMRGVAEDQGAAELMGINVNLTISITFAIGSALAAIAGVLLCSTYPVLMPTTGSMPGIKAFTAAVFGGIGSIPGAMLGGILLGVIEILGKAYVSTELGDALVFGVLIIVLLVKPTGLLGKKVHEKVCEVHMSRARRKRVSNLITYAMVIAAFIICQIALSGSIDGFKMTRSLKGQLVPICVYIVMAVSLNLTVGISGELSLGHAGFMSVGAFSGIIMSSWLVSAFQMENETVRLILAMLAGGVFAGVAGVLIGIPVLRLRGDYLAIVTLAFGEIIRNVLNCLYFSVDGKKLHMSFNVPNLAGKMIYNGPAGATGVDKIATFTMGFVLVLFTLFVVLNLINSRSGRAIMAIRDSRVAAESVGINVTKYKMMAFVTSAALAGMAGALFGLNFSTVTAAKFRFDTSILVLVFVVLGGIGNIRGSVIAAALLTVLPEMLRAFSDYRMLVYAIVLIAVMLVSNSPLLRNVKAMLRRGAGKGEAA